MRHHAGLSYGFWSFAVCLAVYVYNRTPLIRTDYKTPFELWYRKQPDISHLRVFGCLAYVHVLKIKRKKLDPVKTVVCKVVGSDSDRVVEQPK